jgi:hypothetical protein
MSYFVEISKYKSIRQKTKELKKINKFQHASSLDSKLKSLINYIIKIIGAIVLIVFIFTIIYYSSIEFLNMKYGGDYKDMYDKPQTGAEKFRSIPNVGEQVKIKAEREMIFIKICDEIKSLE